MQAFTFSLSRDSVVVDELSGLEMHLTPDVAVYFTGISAADAVAIAACETEADILQWFAACETARFAVFVHHKALNRFYAFNDVFGYQEIFIIPQAGQLTISSTIPYRADETYNHTAIYELLSFQSVVAPQTVIDGVEIVPLAQCAAVDLADCSHRYQLYWDMRDKFANKATDYQQLTSELRDAFYQEIVKEPSQKLAVALSGGVDSGCILGILHDKYNRDIPTVSFGPYGKDSNDLESSRITAAYFHSTNTELYPDKKLFIDMIDASRSLAVPVSGEQLVTNVRLLKTAKAAGADTMYFGYGTQMLLGNLGLNQLWHKIWWFEKIFPTFLRKIVYRFYLGSATDNRKNILLASDWAERFVYKYAPLLSRERQVYKNLPETFVQDMLQKLQPTTSSHLKLSDQIVQWCFSSWMNYGQGRNVAAIGRALGMDTALPYNTQSVAQAIAQASDDMRRRNNWNKQLWRDAIRPYIPDHLYGRKGKSLTIAYDQILLPEREAIIAYLADSALLQDVIDFDELRDSIEKLPEPGLLLLRLLSIAIWHDARTGSNRSSQLRDVFDRLVFS